MIQFQRLLDVCKATETLPIGGFDMGTINCGTVGCMIGNYNAMTGRAKLRFGTRYGRSVDDHDCAHFGITEREYKWLFDLGVYRGCFEEVLKTNWSGPDRDIANVTSAEALRRLRKFIYYKLHKHEMCYDEKYGVKESARRAEGNHCFAMRAKAKADAGTQVPG